MRVAFFAIVILLTGCGGGGSNPLLPKYSPSPYYSTPVKVGTFIPLYNTSVNDSSWAVLDLHTEPLTSLGDNVIVTGFKSQPATASNWNSFQMQVYGWQNGQLVNHTRDWFGNSENIIIGTTTAKFEDLDGNGRLDMVVVPYTDGALSSKFPFYIYFNNPNNYFTRSTFNINVSAQELSNGDSKNYIEAHDVTIADINNDGRQDIVMSDYGWNTSISINQGNRNFVTYTQPGRSLPPHSSIAVADFLNNGTKTLLAVDLGNSIGNTHNEPGLYSWNIDNSNFLRFDLINIGPKPRFELPKWSSYKFGGGAPGAQGHNVRVIAYDWNSNGVMDAIVLSRASYTNGQWPKYSEIQFLKNNGSGNFTDETDNVVVGYDTNTVVSYNPKFLDINGDGLIDIFLPTAGDFSGANNSSQILLKTSDGKYMSAYQNVLTSFSTNTNALEGQPNVGNTVNILRNSDNKLYLVTAVKLSNNQMAVYLSLIGDSLVNAQQAISTVQARWPWMNDVTANAVLQQSAKLVMNNNVIDLDAALSPIGNLQIKNFPITGFVSGIKLDSNQLPVQALDGIGRNFPINISPSVVSTSNFWSKNYTPDLVAPRSQTEYLIGGSNYEYNNLRFGGHDGNWSIGTPLLPINEFLSINAQITTLNYNPWIQFSGMWGSVNYSSMFESTLTFKKTTWQSQIGYILNTTNINPGLITKVNDFHALWLETGYATEKFGFFAGVRPWIVNGSINADLPTSVDTQGNLHYTSTQFKINNPVNMYLRTVYTDTITKNLAYKFSGMYVDNGLYRTQLEFKYSY